MSTSLVPVSACSSSAFAITSRMAWQTSQPSRIFSMFRSNSRDSVFFNIVILDSGCPIKSPDKERVARSLRLSDSGAFLVQFRYVPACRPVSNPTGAESVHGFSQQGVISRLVSLSLASEPGEDIRVDANGQGLFDRPVELSDDCFAP